MFSLHKMSRLSNPLALPYQKSVMGFDHHTRKISLSDTQLRLQIGSILFSNRLGLRGSVVKLSLAALPLRTRLDLKTIPAFGIGFKRCPPRSSPHQQSQPVALTRNTPPHQQSRAQAGSVFFRSARNTINSRLSRCGSLFRSA